MSYRLACRAMELGKLAEAARLLKDVLAANAGHAAAWLQFGVLRKALGDLSGAGACFERATHLVPADPATHYNLGVVFGELGRLAEALKCFERALELHPRYAKALSNRGAVLARLGQNDAAIESFTKALEVDSGFADARYNLGIAELLLARFETGWRNYESRWVWSRAKPRRHCSIPVWTGGSPVQGRRILIWSEQGFGDVLQFCRYVPMVAALGAEVVLEIPQALKNLLANLTGVRSVHAEGESLPSCELQSPLLSLPLAFGTKLSTIPAQVPYLQPDEDAVKRAHRRLADGTPRLRVGIACSGNREHSNDANRSMPLEHFAPLFGWTRLFLMQKDLRPRDEAFLRTSPIEDLRSELTNFADTAAYVENMDLLLSVDTALVHLAGALGKPTWVLLSRVADWRWLTDRDDSPWYPSLRLFRQSQLADWATLIHRVAMQLRQFQPRSPA